MPWRTRSTSAATCLPAGACVTCGWGWSCWPPRSSSSPPASSCSSRFSTLSWRTREDFCDPKDAPESRKSTPNWCYLQEAKDTNHTVFPHLKYDPTNGIFRLALSIIIQLIMKYADLYYCLNCALPGVLLGSKQITWIPTALSSRWRKWWSGRWMPRFRTCRGWLATSPSPSAPSSPSSSSPAPSSPPHW